MGCFKNNSIWILYILFLLIPILSTKEEITTTVGSVSKPTTTKEPNRRVRYPCHCRDGECGCCSGSILANFNVNVQNRACVNVTYFPEDFEFHMRLILNDVIFYQRRMSGKNPRPLCAALPYISAMKMCVVFSNVYVISRNLHMCLGIEGKFRENTLFSYSFDCIRVGTNGLALLKPEEGGGLGPPKPVIDNTTVGEDYDAIVASEGDDIQSAKVV